jgi:hypothetical protein
VVSVDPAFLVAGISGALAALAGVGFVALSKRQRPLPQLPPSAPPAGIDLNTALETVLVKAMDSQTNMFERMQKLNIENAQLALDSIQRRRYSKGGVKRAATAARTRRGKFERDCRLCEDPMIADPSVAEIIAHSTHKIARRPPAPAVAVEEKNGVIYGHVDERDVDTDASGRQQVECGDCLQGIPHEHGRDA